MKSITKSLRLTQKQWESINLKVQESGLTFSQYAINKLDSSNETKKQKQMRANRELIIELAKQGNNLNQLTKHLNTQKSGLDRVGLEMLKRIEEHLNAIRIRYDC